MASATVKVSLKIEAAEADGSNCMNCGDAIYLKAYQVRAYISNKPGKLIGSSSWLFCQSCGESMMEDF